MGVTLRQGSVRAGYKQTEVGVIPEDWDVRQLGKHASFKTGPFGSALHQSDYVDYGIPVINPMQIVNGKIVPTSSMSITEQAIRKLSDFRLTAGDIVIGRRGDMGRCAVVNAVEQGWLCGTGSMIIKTDPTMDCQFVQRILSSPPAIAAIENTSVGSTMINLNQGTLKNLLIPIPQKPEQTAIATALSDTDALIQSLEKLIAKKRTIKQGAMQELLTGKRRLPGFEKKKGFQKTEIGEIPADWQLKTFSDLFNISGGYSASRDQLSDAGYCYLHYGDIHTSNKVFIDVKHEFSNIPKLNIALGRISSKSLLADGDIVFVDASEDDDGTNKHIIVRNKENITYISGLHTIVAKGKTDEMDNLFKESCFQTQYIKKQFYYYAVGTKVSGISKSNIAKVFLPVPKKEEQTAIATILSDMDSSLSTLEAKLSKYRTIKQGMMQELLTGKIRLVTESVKATGKTRLNH